MNGFATHAHEKGHMNASWFDAGLGSGESWFGGG